MEVKKRDINSERDLVNVLDSMYQLSKEKNEPFYNLVEIMMNKETIVSAIHKVKSNKGKYTAGVDGKNINDFLQMPEEKVISIIRSCINEYTPLPVKRIYIDKANGKKRPLGIPTIIDRIIQELAKTALEPIAEAKFYEYSYGYRPYRSTEHAIAEILERIRRSKTYWVIEGDIKSFFDNLNHNKLIKMLWNMGVKDKRFLMIIKKMLKAGVMEDGKFLESDIGTPQGGIISPLLANVYLNNFDWMIAELYQQHPARYTVHDPERQGLAKVRKRHNQCHLVRYADDWIILCDTKEQAEKILKKVDKYLRHVLNIQLSEEKTLITNCLEKKVSFLGFKFMAQPEFNKPNAKIMGKVIPNMEKLNAKVREISILIRKIDKIKPSIESDPARYRATLIERINSKIVGLANYYSISSCSHIFKSLDQRLYNQSWHTWRGINGDKGLWEDFTVSAKNLTNRIERHKSRNDRLFAIEVDGVYIGITKFQFTKSVRALKFNNKMTPYTAKGRQAYEKRIGKNLPLIRGTYYTELELWYSHLHYKKTQNPLRNFEYKMNREYALIRDKGQCKCCGIDLRKGTLHCHHIRPHLPKDQVNKVSNLATVCINCHHKIHGKQLINTDLKVKAKIKKYRGRLERETV